VIEETRGQDVVVLDLTKITPIADYFIIATGTSSRQMRAAAGEVHRLFKAAGSNRIGLEGEGGNTWMLQDFGDIVVHLFTSEARETYDLENLWGDAPRIDWKAELEKAVKPEKTPKAEKTVKADKVTKTEKAPPKKKSKPAPKPDTEGEAPQTLQPKTPRPRAPRKKKKPSAE